MKILNEKPPVIWEKVHKQFDIDDNATIYTWGDAIYNPANLRITEDLFVHERTHMLQQSKFGGPEQWWDEYLKDANFRYTQEVEAYQAQYKFFCGKNKDRNIQFRYLRMLSLILSSPMYKMEKSASEALTDIKK